MADRAGVSRQLVSAVESGRHEPGVSAALALASALGASVETLFGTVDSRTLDATAVFDRSIPKGPVRVGMVAGRAVAEPVAPLEELDGAVVHGRWMGDAVELRAGARPASLVLAGCEPALGVLAALVSDGAGALWVKASSGDARAALIGGRVHVAAVHDRADRLAEVPAGVAAFELARWRVGVAFDPRRARSAAEAVESGAPLVQRERGAGTQAAFARWIRREGRARSSGPMARGHVEVCRLVAVGASVGGVTAEPAAIAAGLGFDPLEEHVVQLWVRRDHLAEPAVVGLMDRFTSSGFVERVAAMPAYDTAGLGAAVA